MYKIIDSVKHEEMVDFLFKAVLFQFFDCWQKTRVRNENDFVMTKKKLRDKLHMAIQIDKRQKADMSMMTIVSKW